jgi:AcrR family transcriptional regulator
MGRPRQYDDALRERLLASAERAVAQNGADAMSVRAIAADAGTSTKAVYTIFGGRQELVAELVRRATASFEASQDAVGVTDDPAMDFLGLGMAYWDWSIANPHLYAIMFGTALGTFVPEPEDLSASRATFHHAVDACQRCADAGITDMPPELLAYSGWAAVHGAVSLELARRSPIPEEAVRETVQLYLRRCLSGWIRR